MSELLNRLLANSGNLLRCSLLASAAIMLSACGTVDKVKDRFGGDEEKTALEDISSDEAPAAPVAINPRQQLTIDIQQSLDELGYAPGRTDGKMDSQTEAAIQDFQLDNDLRINGRPSEELLLRLKRALRLR